jgi:hypothetical protein
MNTITVNPSIILQGTLTFVTAIAISDATRELIVAMKPSSVYTAAMIKAAMAVAIIFIVMLIIYYSPTNKSTAETPMLFPVHEIFSGRKDVRIR